VPALPNSTASSGATADAIVRPTRWRRRKWTSRATAEKKTC
jgi:hypothetical protein